MSGTIIQSEIMEFSKCRVNISIYWIYSLIILVLKLHNLDQKFLCGRMELTFVYCSMLDILYFQHDGCRKPIQQHSQNQFELLCKLAQQRGPMRAILEIGLTKVVNKYLFHKSAAKYDRFVQHPELINMEYSKFSPTQKAKRRTGYF